MPENASLDTLKRQRSATTSSSPTSPYSPSGCPTQLTNKSKLQMSVRHVRVGGRAACTCVCVCALHISLRRRLCLILHFTCAIFCFEKPLLPAGKSTPPPGFAAANWQQLVAVATLFAQLPMKMFDNWRHLLYA